MHLVSANEISEGDPAGGYTLVYDAARKALTAVFENQGLSLSFNLISIHIGLYVEDSLVCLIDG